MKKRTRMKADKRLIGERLFTDFGAIGYYRVLKVYDWEEYCANAVTHSGSHWFKHSMAKIKTEYGVVMKIPFIELAMRSTYADSGEIVLK